MKWIVVGILYILAVIVFSIYSIINVDVPFVVHLFFLPLCFLAAVGFLIGSYEMEKKEIIFDDKDGLFLGGTSTLFGILMIVFSIFLIPDISIDGGVGIVTLFLGIFVSSFGLSCTYDMVKSKKEVKE